VACGLLHILAVNSRYATRPSLVHLKFWSCFCH